MPCCFLNNTATCCAPPCCTCMIFCTDDHTQRVVAKHELGNVFYINYGDPRRK